MRGEIKPCDNGCGKQATETLSLDGGRTRIVRHYCPTCFVAALQVIKTYLGALR